MTALKQVGFTLAVFALSLCPPLGQTSQAPSSTPGTTTTPQRRQPCWQQAGITRSAMQQRKAIGEKTRSQVESVCNDSALSPQQKQEQIRRIHQQARVQLDAVMSPEQQRALKSCRMERDEAEGLVHSGRGPCGEILPRNRPGPGTAPEQVPQAHQPTPGPDQN